MPRSLAPRLAASSLAVVSSPVVVGALAVACARGAPPPNARPVAVAAPAARGDATPPARPRVVVPAMDGAAPRTFALPVGCGPAGARYACDPLTNAGCDAAKGEACDDDEHGGFRCYPPPNAVKIGGDCNVAEGPSCAPGLVCSGATESDPDGECARYCCASADCAKGERCVPLDAKLGALGACE